jgi:DUF4097 and DUF4098 domain-containing protein YvlB
MQKTFSTPNPVSLYVELGSGGVTLHTDETDQTSVDVNGRNADAVIVEQRGDEIVVIARQGRGGFFGSSGDLDVHVSLPHFSKVTTKLGSADLRAMGRLGQSMIRSGSGDVEIEDVDGDLVVESGSGDLGVDRITGDLRVKSGSGDVTVQRVAGDASIATGSGDVELETAGGAVEVKSGSGDLRVREAQQDVALSTASGDLVVDRMSRGQLAAKNVSGDITVGIPAGIPVWTDITSMTGSVRSDLEGAGEPDAGEDYVELRARTVSGDVYLEQL